MLASVNEANHSRALSIPPVRINSRDNVSAARVLSPPSSMAVAYLNAVSKSDFANPLIKDWDIHSLPSPSYAANHATAPFGSCAAQPVKALACPIRVSLPPPCCNCSMAAFGSTPPHAYANIPIYRIDSQPAVFSRSIVNADCAFSGVNSSIKRANNIWLLIGFVSRNASVTARVIVSAVKGVPPSNPYRLKKSNTSSSLETVPAFTNPSPAPIFGNPGVTGTRGPTAVTSLTTDRPSRHTTPA